MAGVAILLRGVECGLDDLTKTFARVQLCAIEGALAERMPCDQTQDVGKVERTYLGCTRVYEVRLIVKLPNSFVANGIELEDHGDDLDSSGFDVELIRTKAFGNLQK